MREMVAGAHSGTREVRGLTGVEDAVIDDAPTERGGRPVYEKGKQILDVARLNVSDPQFSVDRLADAVGISASYLREIVESEFGTGPRWLIETIRIEEALKMLANGGGSIFSISRKVGYSNVRSFRKAFEKRVGRSPSECREYLHNSMDRNKALDAVLKEVNGGQ